MRLLAQHRAAAPRRAARAARQRLRRRARPRSVARSPSQLVELGLEHGLPRRARPRATRAQRSSASTSSRARSAAAACAAVAASRAAATSSSDCGGIVRAWPPRARRVSEASSALRRLAAEREPLAAGAQPVERGGRAARGRRRRRSAPPRHGLAPRASSAGSCSSSSRRSRELGGAAPLGLRRGARRAARGRASRSRPGGAAISSPSFSARSAAVACSASGRSRLRTSSSTSRARSTCVATRASFSSARCRRRLKRPRPAASSTSSRRSDGFAPSTDSTLPCEITERSPPPRPTSESSSTRSMRRTAARLTRYCPSPPRCSRRATETSENGSSGQAPSSLSKSSSTSQKSTGLRVDGAGEEHVVGLLGAQLVRAQRAGGPEDRVGDVRLARAVRPDHDGDPGSRRTSTGSTNDLKPRSLIAFRCTRGRGYRAARMPPPRRLERQDGAVREAGSPRRARR